MILGTDYLGGGYMFYHFIGERIGAGALPKWVPYVYGGMPLAANPGSTYHPVHFLADLVLPTAKVLTVVFLVHFWLAGLGTYLLARELRCRAWVAFVAGLAFQFTGITMSWVYTGHDGRVMVATMIPLVFYFLHLGVRTGGLTPFVGASASIGFALLTFQIQNAYYLLLAGAIWGVYSLFEVGAVRDRGRLGRTVALGLLAVGLAFALAAVDFLPFLDYVPQSPRGGEGGRGYEYSTSYSMPLSDLSAIAAPEQAGASVTDAQGAPMFREYHGPNGFKLHTEYVGAFVLVLLALGFRYARDDRRWWFFLGLGAFFLTIALGGSTPLYRLWYEVLPGTKKFRAPSISYYVVAFSLVAMAALTLERLASICRAASVPRAPAAAREPLAAVPWIAGGVAVAGVVAAALVGGAVAPPGVLTPAQGWMRFAFFAALVAVALWAWTSGRTSSGVAAVLLALITLADLWIIDRKFFHTTDGPEVVFAEDDVVAFLKAQPGRDRIWAFPFPQPWRAAGANGGNYPMLFDIDQVGGEHPNPLQRWVAYLGAGTATYTDWHNFVSDPKVVETPAGQAIAFESAPGFLDAANVRYVVSMAPLSDPALREVYRGSALVYENTRALPRAYLVPRVEKVQGDALAAKRAREWNPREVAFVPAAAPIDLPEGPLSGNAQLQGYGPDRVEVRTTSDRAALLVLADNYYDGWKATVDGDEAPVVLANSTLRGVAVPAGTHAVVFRYAPARLYRGLAISLATALLLASAAAVALFRRRLRAEMADAG
jgi:hypothetical protein